MKKLNIVGVCVISILSFIVWAVTQSNSKLKERVRNADNALKVVSTGFRMYKTSDGLKAAEIESLNIRIRQLKAIRPEVMKELKTLGLKGRDLETVVSTNSIYRDTVTLLSVDSVIVYQGRIDTLKCLDYSDLYFRVKGCHDGEGYVVDYELKDSLTIVESVKYKRFLGFLWKTKKIRDRKIDVKARNPKFKIENLEFIAVDR